MVVLKNLADYHRLAQEFEDSVEEVPGTHCLRSRQKLFTVKSRQKKDHYRTYLLTAYETALLLYNQQIPDPKNLRVERTCSTIACCNAGCYTILPCHPGGTNSSNKVSRLHTARTPEQLFPPEMLKPIGPRGHVRTGTRNPATRLTDEQAERILRARYIGKKSYSAIAADEGLPLRTVISVSRGHSHRHVAQRLLPELAAGALGEQGAAREAQECAAPR